MINRVSVTKDMALEEGSVHANEAFRVQRTAHVVDVCLPGTIKTREITSPKGVQDPCQLVLGVLLDERLVCRIRVILGEFWSGPVLGWRMFKTQFFVAISQTGAATRRGVERAVIRDLRSRGTTERYDREDSRSSLRTPMGGTGFGRA